jgi:hypothetical protein
VHIRAYAHLLARGFDESSVGVGFSAKRLASLIASGRVHRPYASRNLRAALALDRCDVVLALEIEPELSAVAEIAAEADGGIGGRSVCP